MMARDPHHDPSTTPPAKGKTVDCLCGICHEKLVAPAQPSDALRKAYEAHVGEKHGARDV